MKKKEEENNSEVPELMEDVRKLSWEALKKYFNREAAELDRPKIAISMLQVLSKERQLDLLARKHK